MFPVDTAPPGVDGAHYRGMTPTPESTQPRTAPAPRKISCTSSAELLAALPHLLGFEPHNSLVMLSFAGQRSGAAVRLDLPAADTPAARADTVRILDAALASLAQRPPAGTPGVASVQPNDVGAPPGQPTAGVLVFVTDRKFVPSRAAPESTPQDQAGAPWRTLATEASAALQRAGLATLDACCVAADAWGSYLDPQLARSGRPLSEIQGSAVGQELRSTAMPPRLERLGAAPTPSHERRRAVSAAIASLPTPSKAVAGHTSVTNQAASFDAAAVESVARLLRAESPLTPRNTATVIGTLRSVPQWLGVVFGLLIAPERAAAMLREPGPARGLHALGVAATAAERAGWEQLRSLLAGAARLFTDHAGAARRAHRLSQIIAECPTEERVPLYALSAVTWWLAGLQSVSQQQVAAALRIAPANPLAHFVDTLTRVPATVNTALSAGGRP